MDNLIEKIHKIDINVEVLISKQNDILSILEKHETNIADLKRFKYIVYGMSLILSGVISISIAFLSQVLL